MKMRFALTQIAALSTLAATAFAAPPPGHPQVDEQDRALHSAAANYPNKGKALEVIQTQGYTYIHVDKGDDTTEWVAVSTMEISQGDEVMYSKGMTMKDFYSKTLKRKFPEIIFSGAAEATRTSPAVHPTMEETASILNIPADGDQLTNKGQVLRSVKAGMYTYIEVDSNGKTQWLAAPAVDIKDGARIRYGEGAVMTDFYSKSLEREFKEVIFLTGVQVIK